MNDSETIKQQQEDLERSEIRFESFSQLASEAIIFYQEDIVVDVNPSFLTLFGYLPIEVPILNVHNLVDIRSWTESRTSSIVPNISSSKMTFSPNHMNTNSSYETYTSEKSTTFTPKKWGRANCTKKDKSVFVAEVTIFSTDNNTGVVLVRDISALLKAESADAAEKVARAASDAKSKALVTLSHELRTPLSTIIGNLELLKDFNEGTVSEGNDYTVAAWKAASSMLILLNDILDIAKLEKGALELENIPFSFEEVIQDVMDILCSSASAKGIDIFGIVPPIFAQKVVGDPYRLKQVLVNLMGNSIKFTKTGYVGLTVKYMEISDEKLAIRISIEDTGIGMNEAQRQRIFKPFMQGDSSTTRQFGGTGLGLSISEELLKLMGGVITVDSIPSHGTQFHVEITLAKCDDWKSDLPLMSEFSKNSKYLIYVDTKPIENALVEMFEFGGSKQLDVGDISELLDNQVQHSGDEVTLPLQLKTSITIKTTEPYLLIIEDIGEKKIYPILKKLSELTIPVAFICPSKTSHPQVSLPFVSVIHKPFSLKKLREGVGKVQQTKQNSNQKVVKISSLKGVKILLVEDNVLNNKLAKTLLEKMGHVVVIAFNGQEALEVLKKEKVDIIFMDNNMPVMDGLDCTSAIRETDQKTPIIAFTANVFAQELERCWQVGMNDHLPKPFLKVDVEKILDKWCRSSLDVSSNGKEICE